MPGSTYSNVTPIAISKKHASHTSIKKNKKTEKQRCAKKKKAKRRVCNVTAQIAQSRSVLPIGFCLFSYCSDTQADDPLILSAIQSTKMSEANNLTRVAIKAIRVAWASVLKNSSRDMEKKKKRPNICLFTVTNAHCIGYSVYMKVAGGGV